MDRVNGGRSIPSHLPKIVIACFADDGSNAAAPPAKCSQTFVTRDDPVANREWTALHVTILGHLPLSVERERTRPRHHCGVLLSRAVQAMDEPPQEQGSFCFTGLKSAGTELINRTVGDGPQA